MTVSTTRTGRPGTASGHRLGRLFDTLARGPLHLGETAGAVLALDRGEHTRLPALVNPLRPRWRVWFETLGALVVCVFVALVIVPAVRHASGQMDITTPALEI